MDYITMTNLRTESSQLVEQLLRGGKVSLIHRSKLIGVITPVKNQTKKFQLQAFKEALKGIKLKPTKDEERAATYKEHVLQKYGKNFS